MATKITSPFGYLTPPSGWVGLSYLINAGARAVTTVVPADSPYSVGRDESVVLADASTAPITLTLPAAATCAGMVLTVKKTGTGINAVTLDGNGTEEVEGAETYAALDAANDTVTVVCDGTAWHIIGGLIA